MSQQDPHRGWQEDAGAFAAVTARERGRSRMRMATLAAGAASLVTAGVVAWNLPGPTHSSTASTSPASTPSTAPAVTSGGDDGSASDDGATRAASSQPSPQPAKRTTHATSGGS